MKLAVTLGVGLLCVLMVIGCGDINVNTNDGGGEQTPAENQDPEPDQEQNQVPPSTVADIAGNWDLKDETEGKDATVALTQDGQILGGTLDSIKNRNATITGTITSAGVVQMRFTFPKATTDCTLQVQNADRMTGTWTDNREGRVSSITATRK